MPNPFKQAVKCLDEHGWTRGNIQAVTGEVCVLGAIIIGNGFTEDQYLKMLPGTEPLFEYRAFIEHKVLHSNAWIWNDRTVTTQKDVREALKTAAKLWKEEKKLGKE